MVSAATLPRDASEDPIDAALARSESTFRSPRMLDAEGVGRILVLTDEPEKYPRGARWAPGVDFWHRDRLDEAQRIRVDDWELSHVVQAEVLRRWPLLSTETLGELADLPEYRRQFLRLFGFGIDGVDYAQDVDPRVVV